MKQQLEAELRAAHETFEVGGCHVAEARRSVNPDAALCLVRLMSRISEQHYCAGWLVGLEYSLWDMLEGGDRDFGFGPVKAGSLLQLAALSERAQGWWRWSDEAVDEVFVPLAEWRELWAAWVAAGRPDRWGEPI